jgi:hypothetical protein
LTSPLEGCEGSASRPGRTLPPGKTRYPFYRRLGGPQGRSGQVRKISPSPGFDPRTVQPVGSRYTDYATRPTNDVNSDPYKHKLSLRLCSPQHCCTCEKFWLLKKNICHKCLIIIIIIIIKKFTSASDGNYRASGWFVFLICRGPSYQRSVVKH